MQASTPIPNFSYAFEESLSLFIFGKIAQLNLKVFYEMQVRNRQIR